MVKVLFNVVDVSNGITAEKVEATCTLSFITASSWWVVRVVMFTIARDGMSSLGLHGHNWWLMG